MTWQVLEGDSLDVLGTLEPESVQTCITSPPYWGLRDYGTATWEGGDAECDHIKGTAASTKPTLKNDGRPNPGSNNYEHSIEVPYRDTCGKCGATRIDSQLGLEPTPEEYVANLVSVFREVKRVLRDDGTLWLNLGDSYARSGGEQGGGNRELLHMYGTQRRMTKLPAGLKSKDLVGIPWMVAFALRADGWYLRSDIIWAKPNPMPESVTDRPTKAHEYLFLFSRSPRYFYDADAIREAHTAPPQQFISSGISEAREAASRAAGHRHHTLNRSKYSGGPQGNPLGRNKRSVWTVTTQPFPGAHFATFPPKLIEPCILAGSMPCGSDHSIMTRDGLPQSTVLDPFNGAGTTGVVATRLDRSYIGIELNPEYAEMSRNRIRDDAPLLNTGLELAA